MITFLILFACQEKETNTDDLDSLRTQLIDQEVEIALLLENQNELLASQEQLLESPKPQNPSRQIWRLI